MAQTGKTSFFSFLFTTEVTIPEKDKDRWTKNVQTSTLLTAEDCLGQLKMRIKEYHGVSKQQIILLIYLNIIFFTYKVK